MSLERIKEKLESILDVQRRNIQEESSILEYIINTPTPDSKENGVEQASTGILEDIAKLLNYLESCNLKQSELNIKLHGVVYDSNKACVTFN